jgi:Zn finger protein HypA/HybF involved in hydrogenase expression
MKKQSKVYLSSDTEFEEMIARHKTYSDILREIGLSTSGSGSRQALKTRIRLLDISISHFDSSSNNKNSSTRYTLSEILVENSSYQNYTSLKRRLINEGVLEYKCSFCKNDGRWRNMKLALQLDHMNGIKTDNRLENLRLLCPNCHSQTSTYSGKNK